MREFIAGAAIIGAVNTVFPAAAPAADQSHPAGCPCGPCLDALLADLARPLVEPAPRLDPALDRRSKR